MLQKPNLIVALDYTSKAEALKMAHTLTGIVPWVKVGLELFTKEGPVMLESLKDMGFKLMLDLKLFDIPNTVAGAVRSSAAIGADLITVHTFGGEKMLKAAVDTAYEAEKYGKRPLVFGVTVLTSFEEGDLLYYSGSLEDLAKNLAARAEAWGLDGVVCSGQDLQAIKERCPQLQCLTPGIRSAKVGAVSDDQRRIVSPQQAVRLGANFLVVGRPITRAEDPVQAAKIFMEAIEKESV